MAEEKDKVRLADELAKCKQLQEENNGWYHAMHTFPWMYNLPTGENIYAENTPAVDVKRNCLIHNAYQQGCFYCWQINNY